MLGYSPAAAGALVVPTVVAAPLLAGRVGRWTDRTGTRLLTSGLMLLASAALVWIAIFAAHQQIALLLPAFLAFGIARPIATVAGPAGTIAAIPRAARGLSSAQVTEARQLGAVMGVAVLGLVLTGLEVTRRRDLLAGVDSSFGQRPRAARDGILANSIHPSTCLPS